MSIGAVAAGPARWALSVDELRVIALVTGTALPPRLRSDLDDDDLALIEPVAIRSLVAHGLAVLTDEPGVALAPGAANRLAPLLAPIAVAEVDVEVDGTEPRHHVVVAGERGEVLALHERELDIWSVERPEVPLSEVVWELLELSDDGLVPPTGDRLTLPALAHLEVEGLGRAERWEAVTGALTEAGVGGETAQRWRAALQQRRLAASVHLCRTLAPEIFEEGTLRWLDAGTAGVWQLTDESDHEEDEHVVTVIENIGSRAVRDDLCDLLGKA